MTKIRTLITIAIMLLCGFAAMPSMAEELDAPILTDFQQIDPEDGTFSFKAIYPQDAIQAAQEYARQANTEKPIRIVAEIKIDDYDWQSCRVHDAGDLEEYKVFDSEIARKLQEHGNVQLRIKIIDNNEKYPETDWSKILAITAKGPEMPDEEEVGEDLEVDEVIESTTGQKTAPKAKRKRKAKITPVASVPEEKTENKSVCPLGQEICCRKFLGASLCTWQITIALIFLILVIIYRKLAMVVLFAIVIAVIFLIAKNTKTADDNKVKTDTVAEAAPSDNSAVPAKRTRRSSVSGHADDPYSYRTGALQQFQDEEGNPRQTVFNLKGLVLEGNSAEGGNAVKEFNTRNIFSSFHLNENIRIYADADYSGPSEAVRIIIAPHRTAAEWLKMSPEQLADAGHPTNGGERVEFFSPQPENSNFVAERHISSDYGKPGNYDIVFTYNDNPAYFVVIEMQAE